MEESEGLQSFLAYHRRMLAVMFGACLVVTVLLIAFAPGEWAWIGGFATGAAAQLLKFGIVDISVVKQVALHPDSEPWQRVKARYGTLALLVLAVILTLKFKLNPWALAAGIFLPRVLLLADTYLRPNVFATPSSAISEGNGGEKEA